VEATGQGIKMWNEDWEAKHDKWKVDLEISKDLCSVNKSYKMKQDRKDGKGDEIAFGRGGYCGRG
jgi:hypothetical protein